MSDASNGHAVLSRKSLQAGNKCGLGGDNCASAAFAEQYGFNGIGFIFVEINLRAQFIRCEAGFRDRNGDATVADVMRDLVSEFLSR